MTDSTHKRRAKSVVSALTGMLLTGLVLFFSGPMGLAGEPAASEFPARFSAQIEQRLDGMLARFEQAPQALPANVRAREAVAGEASPNNETPGLLVPRTPEIEALLARFRSESSSRVARGFGRFSLYAPEINAQFTSAGVPPELALLGLVESGFDPHAVSPKQACGIWQLVPETGRRYGLRVGPSGDDRSDPRKSTRAAARYLSDLYELFGDWPLALAAYNAGENRVLSALARSPGRGLKDFWTLSRRRLLPVETRNYVPAVLATILYAQERGLGLTSAPTKLRAGSYRIFYAGFRLSPNGGGNTKAENQDDLP